jgi:hypothetical protein
MNFTVLTGKYAIYRFRTDSDLPGWIYSSDFYSITCTKEELSVIAVQRDDIPADVICNREWRIIKIDGLLDLSLTGIIADVSDIFNKEKIPVFTLSTFNTDYFLIKQQHLSNGMKALRKRGHTV